MSYRDQIVTERALHRVSQQEIANRLGIFRSTLIDIEAERVSIDQSTFDRIIAAIHAPMLDTREQPPSTPEP